MKVLGNNRPIFNTPDLSRPIPYSPSYKLEEDEWFQLDGFLARAFHNGLIEQPFNSTNYTQILKRQFADVRYFAVKQGNQFCFQKLLPSHRVTNKWFRASDEPVLETEQSLIVLYDYPDAVYDIGTDTLFFRDIARIKVIFKGIEELYREASQEEVDEFLDESFVELEAGFEAQSIQTANRKRIALAMDTFKQFNTQEKQTIFEYTKSYCPSVQTTETAFLVQNEDDLKNVLWGIEQRYFTTLVGNEKRCANSILPA